MDAHLWIFITAPADFEKVNPRFDQQPDLGHGVFEGGGAVVGGIQLDADAERRWHHFADLGDDVQDELGSLFCGPAVVVCPKVCLYLLDTPVLLQSFKRLLPLGSRIGLLPLAVSRNMK